MTYHYYIFVMGEERTYIIGYNPVGKVSGSSSSGDTGI
jgi:hypothetical protein